MAAMRWRPGGVRVGVARAREGQGGGARVVLGLGTTRGGEGGRRWLRGGAGAAVSGADGRWRRNRGQSKACARGGRRGKEVQRTSLEFAKILGTLL
jgi:hypothetical protein